MGRRYGDLVQDGTISVSYAAVSGEENETMATFWGVDSPTPANSNMRGLTLFDFTTQLAGQAPTFWGHYIGGHFALKANEAQPLYNRNCKILVIYKGAHEIPTSVQGGFQEGVKDTNKAIVAAKALVVPGGTWIYVDIKADCSLTADWFKGWSDTMYNSQYNGAAGVYCNPLPENAVQFNDPYCDGLNNYPNLQGADGRASIPERVVCIGLGRLILSSRSAHPPHPQAPPVDAPSVAPDP